MLRFSQLFGEEDPDQDVSPDTADPEAAGGNAGKGALASQANSDGNVKRTSTRQWAQKCKYDPRKLFTKFFQDDIKYLLSMENLWKKRKPPVPVSWTELLEEAGKSDEKDGAAAPIRDMQVWSLHKCAKVFGRSVATLRQELAGKPEGSYLIWDKDDAPAMDFVTACANVRSHIFAIERKSRFDVKSIAGNIIPAIATTNAMIAGLVVLLTFRVLAEEFDRCHSVYLRQKSAFSKNVLVAERVFEPANPKCYVCAPQPRVIVCVNVDKLTVKEFETEILKKALNMVAPDAILDGKGLVVISSEEGETAMNDGKILSALGIVDGSILKVDDFLQNYELTVHVNHYVAQKKDDPEYKIIADNPEDLKAKEEQQVKEVENKNGTNGSKVAEGAGKEEPMQTDADDSDGDLEVIENEQGTDGVDGEEDTDDEEEEGSARKKMKVVDVSDD